MTHAKETKDKFIEMRADGRTLAKTAEELNISYNTAVNWNKEFREDIGAAEAFKVEEMMEKYRMTKEKRIEMYGERLLAIQDELAKRDLSNIPTSKLFDMMIKCSKALEIEAEPPRFLTNEDIEQTKSRRKAAEGMEKSRPIGMNTFREEFAKLS